MKVVYNKASGAHRMRTFHSIENLGGDSSPFVGRACTAWKVTAVVVED